ncbi:hypothetical protein PN462_04375 [Spirulina sp. CS-785/01]|uniref:hypothetical protein n=1 Tax=Spirulina sp. CS-785/01 TaxID=3021716 RepID=UPI002330B0C2|nr:hypothetical protein [Spirulina sp. CS-785/01]MDB9312330.1 hypothetical protein [Spirulina sp. CS-785/01]
MSSLAPNHAQPKPESTTHQAAQPSESQWEFAEIWVDPWLSPPYILMLVKEQSGQFSIQNPAQNYQSIFTSQTYEESQMWLLEDEYERVTGRFWQPD